MPRSPDIPSADAIRATPAITSKRSFTGCPRSRPESCAGWFGSSAPRSSDEPRSSAPTHPTSRGGAVSSRREETEGPVAADSVGCRRRCSCSGLALPRPELVRHLAILGCGGLPPIRTQPLRRGAACCRPVNRLLGERAVAHLRGDRRKLAIGRAGFRRASPPSPGREPDSLRGTRLRAQRVLAHLSSPARVRRGGAAARSRVPRRPPSRSRCAGNTGAGVRPESPGTGRVPVLHAVRTSS